MTKETYYHNSSIQKKQLTGLNSCLKSQPTFEATFIKNKKVGKLELEIDKNNDDCYLTLMIVYNRNKKASGCTTYQNALRLEIVGKMRMHGWT